MAVVCEDLAQYGVALVPPSTVEYFELLADIEQRLRTRPEGSPPIDDATLSRISEHDTGGSAILLNKAKIAIACMAYEWSNTIKALPGTPSVLLPFGMNDRARKLNAYWNTIFPGSKRLMTCDGSSYGDNTDVRPPAPDELSQGGWWSMRAGRPRDGLKAVKLTLDGVFFVDGGFAGPNRLGCWEQTVFAADAYLACASLAREAHRKGTAPAEFFAQVSALTGQTDERRMPPPPPPRFGESGPIDPEPIRRRELQMVGWQTLQLRKSLGDEAAMTRMEAWASAAVPKFHKL